MQNIISAQGNMEIVEFKSRAELQEPVTGTRTVSVFGPELQALLRSGRAIPMSQIVAHPDQKREVKQFTYKHILMPGASPAEAAAWRTANPDLPLPNDLQAFVQQINGVHLWADIAEQQSYFGILPLSRWCNAAKWKWVGLFERPPSGLLVLSYHNNGDFYLLLDTKAGKYYWYDVEDFDKPKFIGASVSELLTWWWRKAGELDPRERSPEIMG